MNEQEIIDNWLNMRQQPIQLVSQDDFWQQVRIQAAIAAMQGMLSSKETMVSITAKAKERNISVPKALAMLSVSDADALVEELKKGEK